MWSNASSDSSTCGAPVKRTEEGRSVCSTHDDPKRSRGSGDLSVERGPLQIPSRHRLQAGFSGSLLRSWQGVPPLQPSNLVFPVFVVDQEELKEEIRTMPGQFRFGYKTLVRELSSLVEKGLGGVMIFGVVEGGLKDERGTCADSLDGPVIKALQILKRELPQLLLVADVCLCEYTNHGHCGILDQSGRVINKCSVDRIAEIAVAYARAGADVLAPSDMSEGRVMQIKKRLLADSEIAHKAVMSYSAKFASAFYGPFREAAGSAPSFGDRKCYQLPPEARTLGIRASLRDAEEGADFLMVKPASHYLDVVKALHDRVDVPLAVYQVSGEYAMLKFASEAGALDLRTAVLESVASMQRAGASVVITYFAPELLDWLP
uniref:Delta-aminolevulinic acid dehydratase n=1 Tax=Chromera velia CCMP2878 TaxID=1169474 RepID=A0A0G4IF79_9ALVE|eukprot:Cvel_13826.t1-p1 / transcript=Cvel_13826.t1 / gene=Cvel_13826 / organism=Chromera_velia_CCMP2878 / gene_product=Delta-aminolevulinic acid dehydratase, putative / transcript_product=Delta-aminolevulinic acid dehydratase, putative / location=Cvel_scaffold960:10984-14959(+) / protein_length=375 / sequence_SO=supercontig / SO=protein_coding / is_pseudo=false